jgi:ubiquinone/menaquinone biosynthesis C-methylase UbiE
LIRLKANGRAAVTAADIAERMNKYHREKAQEK